MKSKRISWKNILWLLLAYAALALGLIGAFLPILPTTPFLLVSVWAGSHASSKFKWWLMRHKRFGSALRDWYRYQAIARPAKLTAVAVIAASWLIIIFKGSSLGVVVLTGLLLGSCVCFLLTRPEPNNFQRIK
jgi:uncharacterized membrane protein YbaN (DUF454 family)